MSKETQIPEVGDYVIVWSNDEGIDWANGERATITHIGRIDEVYPYRVKGKAVNIPVSESEFYIV